MSALKIASLRNEGIPEELANRMMVAHGSRELLRCLRGEPEPVVMPTFKRSLVKVERPYIAVRDMPPLALPSVVRGIIEEVADAFEVDFDELRGIGKAKALVLARAVAIRLIRDRTWKNGEPKHSFPTIGRYLRRDHSSICHSVSQFDHYAKQFPEVREVYESLKEMAA